MKPVVLKDFKLIMYSHFFVEYIIFLLLKTVQE